MFDLIPSASIRWPARHFEQDLSLLPEIPQDHVNYFAPIWIKRVISPSGLIPKGTDSTGSHVERRVGLSAAPEDFPLTVTRGGTRLFPQRR